jgi:hypothetical protein
MDAFDIFTPANTDGRLTALALRDMNLRAVVALDGLRLVTQGARTSSGCSPAVVGPKYQPRDAKGRFVAYWMLSLEILTDFADIEYEYGLEDYPEEPTDTP